MVRIKRKVNQVLKKWQKKMDLENWSIYVVYENKKVMSKFWQGDARYEDGGVVKGDVVCDNDGKLGFIRLNKDQIQLKEIEEVVIHELLHIKMIDDEEWLVERMTEILKDL